MQISLSTRIGSNLHTQISRLFEIYIYILTGTTTVYAFHMQSYICFKRPVYRIVGDEFKKLALRASSLSLMLAAHTSIGSLTMFGVYGRHLRVYKWICGARIIIRRHPKVIPNNMKLCGQPRLIV